MLPDGIVLESAGVSSAGEPTGSLAVGLSAELVGPFAAVNKYSTQNSTILSP